MLNLVRTYRLLLATTVVVGLLVAPLAQASSKTAGPPPNAPTLPIGGVGPLSGGGGAWGLAVERGLQLAIDDVNSSGGLRVGGTVYRLKEVMYDDNYTGVGGATAATRLVTADGAKFIIGSIGSPPVLGMLPITQAHHVIVLSDGFASAILRKFGTYNFRVVPTTTEFAPPMAKWLREHYPAAKTVGFISPNDEIGQILVPEIVKAYQAQGFKVVFNENYARGTTDFTPLLTRMMEQKVDIFDLNSNAPGDAGLLVKQARQVGYKNLIVQTGGPGIGQVVKIAGPLANGFISYDNFDPNDVAAKHFVAEYHAKYQGVMDSYTPYMYTAAQILFEALRRANSLNANEVVSTIDHMDGYPTMFGPVQWTGQRVYGVKHQLATSFYIAKVIDGKVHVIAKI